MVDFLAVLAGPYNRWARPTHDARRRLGLRRHTRNATASFRARVTPRPTPTAAAGASVRFPIPTRALDPRSDVAGGPDGGALHASPTHPGRGAANGKPPPTRAS